MADIDDEESSGDEESSQDEMGSEAGDLPMDDAVDDNTAGMTGENDIGLQTELIDRDAPRFPDMPQTATAPMKTPNFNLFPNRYEHLMPPPIVSNEEPSKVPYVILFMLGVVLALLSMIE